jgi:hypothetical protein
MPENKCVFLTAALFCNIICYAADTALHDTITVHLNSHGHIVSKSTAPESQAVSSHPSCFVSNNLFFVRHNDTVFNGHSLYPLPGGVLTLETAEGARHACIRIYSSDCTMIFETTVPAVINFSLSDSRSHALFYDGTGLAVLSCSTGELNMYPGALVFSCDEQGIPAYYSRADSALVYGENSYQLPHVPKKIIRFNDSFLAIAGNTVYQLHDETCDSILECSGMLFDCAAEGGTFYLVERTRYRDRYIYVLYASEILDTFIILEQKAAPSAIAPALPAPVTHACIRAPLNFHDSSYPFRIGNSYAEIQEYGGSPYLHPGVDFLGLSSQAVYAVHGGVVKAVLTTGGSLYWRVAVANEDTTNTAEGYLYANLVENSIPVTVGDTVSAGDFLGELVPWPVADFTHIHFARIRHNGETWDGSWITTDNPLVDVTNMIDHTPPVFENALDDSLFAFRNPDGDYLPANGLFNDFDVIVKCHDLANSGWRIDVWDLAYTLHPYHYPGFTIYSEPAYAFDMPLGVYAGESSLPIISNIYSRDATCYSIGNYTDREYYHLVTNSFNQLPAGPYLLSITACDASFNSATTSMPISVIANPPAGILAVNTLQLGFGKTFPGMTNTHFFTVINTGTAQQAGNILNVTVPFHTLSNNTFTLTPQSNTAVVIAFSPEEPGVFTNIVTLAGNGTVDIILTGEGIPEPAILCILLILLPLLRKF